LGAVLRGFAVKPGRPLQNNDVVILGEYGGVIALGDFLCGAYVL